MVPQTELLSMRNSWRLVEVPTNGRIEGIADS
jgi:hypothetical protein